MRRYNFNSRLFKYTVEEKKRYKLYKKKKMWVVAGVSLFSTASLVSANASADELHQETVNTDDTHKHTTESTKDSTVNDMGVEDSNTTKENSAAENEKIDQGVSLTESISSQKVDPTEDFVKTEIKEDTHALTEDENTVKEDVLIRTKDTVGEKDIVSTNSEVKPKNVSGEDTSKETQSMSENEKSTVNKNWSDLSEKVPTSIKNSDTKGSVPIDESSIVENKVLVPQKGSESLQGADIISPDKNSDIKDMSVLLSKQSSVFRSAVNFPKRESVVLATTNTSGSVDEGDTTGRSIEMISVTKKNDSMFLSEPEVLADGSTKYIITADNFGYSIRDGLPGIDMAIRYTGKNNDTFTMLITPGENTSLDVRRNPGYSMKPSGKPEKREVDGGWMITWKITDVPENTTVTRTQIIPNVYPFSDSGMPDSNNFPPYYEKYTEDYTLKNGANYNFRFFINGKAAPANTAVKIVANKVLKIKKSSIRSYSEVGSKVVDTNYVYYTSFNLSSLTKSYPSFKTFEATYTIPVPEHFLLDTEATNNFINKTKMYNGYYLGGAVTVTQPKGEGTPIIIKSKGQRVSTLDLPFIGRYTSTDTSGKSDVISGWIDLGDGQKQYFGKINVDTNEYLDDDDYVVNSRGFDEKVVENEPNGANNPMVHEHYNVSVSFMNDEQTAMRQETTRSRYDELKNKTTTSGVTTIRRELPALEKGDSSAPLLYTVGVIAEGLTEFKPTYHMEFPPEITSTGIVMPLNNVGNDYVDFGSYNSVQPGYTVVVTGEDGSKITQHLLAGESYNPVTGNIDHFGSFFNGEKLVDGVRVKCYDVTPDEEYYPDAYMKDFSSGAIVERFNDVATGQISVLG